MCVLPDFRVFVGYPSLGQISESFLCGRLIVLFPDGPRGLDPRSGDLRLQPRAHADPRRLPGAGVFGGVLGGGDQRGQRQAAQEGGLEVVDPAAQPAEVGRRRRQRQQRVGQRRRGALEEDGPPRQARRGRRVSPAEEEGERPIYDGPIRRRKRGYILTTDQSDAGSVGIF
eukprot:1184102-Prorocentrum_minimum.AAC.8